MAFLFGYEISFNAGHLEDSRIISGANQQSARPFISHALIQLFYSFEINSLVNVVVQVGKQSVHQHLFNLIHFSLPP